MKTAFPQTQNPVSIRLYSNIPFDNTYEHHSLISKKFKYNNSQIYAGTLTASERFLDRRRNATGNPYYYPRYDMTDTFNFDFQNGLVGSVVLDLTPEQTNANYMRVTCATDVYYYFITGIRQINFDTYVLSLELDVLMTYQDEFLDGMEDIPVMTNRKHCHRYTNNGRVPHCADFKSGENIFAGVKPSVVKTLSHLKLKGAQTTKLSELKWMYVCVDMFIKSDNTDLPYSYKGCKFPMSMICIPLCKELKFKDVNNNETTITETEINTLISKLVGDGKVHACKISSYPPFYSTNIEVTKGTGVDEGKYTIKCTEGTEMDIDNGIMLWTNQKTMLISGDISSSLPPSFINAICIIEEYECDYPLTDVSLDFINTTAPSITSNRYQDPKLLFAPFRKYMLSAVYSQGSEFFPELLFSDGTFTTSFTLKFKSVYTSYIGDYNIFTYLESLTDNNNSQFYLGYKVNNIGLACSVNYIIPAGTNALDLFNSTQAQSYYQSKVASGITSGLTMAGGIASIVIGAGMTATSGGGLTPMGMGMVAGGSTAVASGLAGVADTIKSSVAKVEDLKNTPDSFNVVGGSVTSDYARGDLLPFVVVYDVTDGIKEQADDFLYNYGYQVARECYFNTELKYDNDVSHSVDTMLFGRTIFNYIKLSEDITNKINANIPIIVKKKLSEVFNKGITLWSFFGNITLWSATDTPDTTYNPDKWFMKCILDNTEYKV